ncbi:hypothetical protein OROMI_022921 [Orobanche minor]
MSKFLVALNDMSYPTIDAPFMINICGSTLIYEDPKEEFPNLRFVLKSFADFEKNTNIVTGKLYDIIGMVVNFSEPKEFMNKNGRQSKFSNIILEDTESRRLCHTLWGTQNKRWSSYWICATIKSIGKYGRKNKWYFTECDTCRKGVHDLDPGYYCIEYDKEVCATSKRLFMKVSDSTASAEVIMWDKQCAEVVGRAVSELMEELIDK